jgi:hypothetical protein
MKKLAEAVAEEKEGRQIVTAHPPNQKNLQSDERNNQEKRISEPNVWK